MPQPGMNGLEPAFGEAYGAHRGLLSPYPLAMSPQGGRTEYDQSVLLMLGSPATPRKRPFELLSDLVDDGGFVEDLHPEHWDVSALDEMARYTKLGLGVGVGGELAGAEEAVLIGRWGRSWEEEEKHGDGETGRLGGEVPMHSAAAPGPQGAPPASVTTAMERELSPGRGRDGGAQSVPTVEVYQVAQREEEEEERREEGEAQGAAGSSALEHNYSLCRGGAPGAGPDPHTQPVETRAGGEQLEERGPECGPGRPGAGTEEEEEEAEEEEEEDEELEEEEGEEEEEEEEGAEETTVEAELSSSSETECEAEAEAAPAPAPQPGERPQKRRCFWEYRRARDSASKRKLAGEVRWSLSWSSSTLPSTLYRREGKKGRRKARKTDASDLTPNPQKLHSIGEQLQKLNAAIDGMGPVNELPAVARARSRKEKNKLASRACRLKKKAQHEANKIKLWGLNQEYDNLLGALLRIKEVIRRRVESSEEEDAADERGMTERLEDILGQSSGPLVAGRTKDFVQRILAASVGGQSHDKRTPQGGDGVGV